MGCRAALERQEKKNISPLPTKVKLTFYVESTYLNTTPLESFVAAPLDGPVCPEGLDVPERSLVVYAPRANRIKVNSNYLWPFVVQESVTAYAGQEIL